MSKKRTKIAQVVKRISRVERKYKHLIAEVRALRKAITPRQDELDDVIAHLHDTARMMRSESVRERNYISNIINR